LENRIDEALSTKFLDILTRLKPLMQELKEIMPQDMPDPDVDFESQFENKEHAAQIKQFFESLE